MVRPSVRLIAAAVGVLAAVSLAGCQADAEAPRAAAPSASAIEPTTEPSPQPSRVVVAPTRPVAMDDDGPAGAEAAAVYFLELDVYMQITGDSSAWEEISHPECDFCSARLAQARDIAANGDTFSGGEVSVEVLHTYSQDPVTGVWPVEVRVHQEPTTISRPNGEVAFTERRNSFTATIGVGRRDNDWVVAGLGDVIED